LAGHHAPKLHVRELGLHGVDEGLRFGFDAVVPGLETELRQDLCVFDPFVLGGPGVDGGLERGAFSAELLGAFLIIPEPGPAALCF
jgi:hypothetical protein